MLIHDIFGQDNADLSITFEGYYLPLLENYSLQFHVPDDSVANLLSLDTGLQEYPLLPAYEAKPPSYRSSTASLDSQNELGDSLNRTTSANSNTNSNDIESYVIGPRSDNVEISVPPPAITTESIQTRQANAMESRSLNLQSPTSPTINNLKDTLSLNLPSPNFTGLAETMSIDLPQPYPRTSSNFNMTVPSSSQVGASSSTTVSNSAASNANIETTNEVISHSVEDYHTVRIEINTIKIDFNTERPTEESIEIPQQQDDEGDTEVIWSLRFIIPDDTVIVGTEELPVPADVESLPPYPQQDEISVSVEDTEIEMDELSEVVVPPPTYQPITLHNDISYTHHQ
ncbi:hypothetical protein HDV02_004152 [Globomyces sp. JEL0801]|nr:hypothetical protein HDV02_004152 [Globomyces sp. JEL0801]